MASASDAARAVEEQQHCIAERAINVRAYVATRKAKRAARAGAATEVMPSLARLLAGREVPDGLFLLKL